jgi:gamma-glutamyl hercynylcysteine S-oxide synthase
MNLELPPDIIFSKIEKIVKQNETSNIDLIYRINSSFKKTIILLDNLLSNQIQGLERDDNMGLTNPLKWELGHVLFFWEQMVGNKLGMKKFIADPNIYDSFKINRQDRWLVELKPPNEILSEMKELLKKISVNLKDQKYNNKQKYIIELAQLHHDMHNESFVFTNQLLGNQILPYPQTSLEKVLSNNILFINIEGGVFCQGADKIEFSFDNERPCFEQKVADFKVSKYCITNSQFLEFVESGGYQKEDLWIPSGWRWIQQKKLTHPIYWRKNNKFWTERIWDKYFPLRLNCPVVHISYYEANAYCKWKGVRLPFEKEWEYLANRFKDDDYREEAHLNYNNEGTISVLKDKNVSNDNVVGLFGNVWEWCQEPIYPYDGFEIDPVYREMSYPFFGFKRICRGGSWAVPSYLITKSYRNAQSDNCTYQYIGFRVCSL